MSNKLVSIKVKRPNILFEQWLTEWMQQETNDTQQKYYENALKALQKFPLPLATGRECIILKGFGEKLCKRLDDKLKNKNKSQPPVILLNNVNINQVNEDNTNKNQLPTEIVASTSNKNTKTYTPAYRSGAYAILCALYKYYNENQLNGVLKKDLIASAQRFCDKSFVKNDQGSLYTAWSSMSTLVSKQLVKKEGNPAKFHLTEAGIPLAKSLYEDAMKDPENAHFINQVDQLIIQDHANDVQADKNKATKRKLPKNPSSSSLQSSQTTDSDIIQETVIFPPGSFKIYLLVDTQETSGTSKTKKDVYDEIIMELNALSVNYEIRHLKIGDYAWICRHDETQQELVLPYIVERKRMDDFGASIKDGRFHEQKFRLKQSGIQNLIYLVESHGNNTHCGMPISSIFQAATNTLLQDGFSLKFTDNIRKTVEYLALFTKLMCKIFVEKTLMNCAKEDLQKCVLGEDLIGLMTFKEFNLSSTKNKVMKVSDMFVKQLLQLHGISVDKALAIVSKYPTPRLLKFAYDACENAKGAEGLLSNIEFGTLNKKVGPVISTTIYQLYNFKDY